MTAELCQCTPDPATTNQCSSMWLAAASAVPDAGGEAYNVVIDIADPLAVMGPDDAIFAAVDYFLRKHRVNTVAGVANTIFPQSLLDRHCPAGLYDAYNEVLPRMKQMTRDWGRYFERMTSQVKVKCQQITIINPLDDLTASCAGRLAPIGRRCHIVERRTRGFCVSNIFK